MGRGKKKDLPKSMCLLSALYDPVNYLTLDVQTGPTDGSEQELLLILTMPLTLYWVKTVECAWNTL
jgi:hypothetical protein